MKKTSDKRMQVIDCYRRMMTKDEEFIVNTTTQYVFVYFKSGCSKMALKGKNYTANAKDIVLIGPKNELIMMADEEGAECICVFIKGGEMEHLIHFSFFGQRSTILIHDCEKVAPIFDSILRQYTTEVHNRYKQVSEIYSLFFALTPEITQKKAQTYVNRFLCKAIAIIEDNPQMHMTVNELAERVNVNRSYLYKKFIEETGMPPKEYIMDHKLQLSVQKLRLKNASVQKISEQLGFTSYRAFEKAFKKKYNMTPMQYKKKVR